MCISTADRPEDLSGCPEPQIQRGPGSPPQDKHHRCWWRLQDAGPAPGPGSSSEEGVGGRVPASPHALAHANAVQAHAAHAAAPAAPERPQDQQQEARPGPGHRRPHAVQPDERAQRRAEQERPHRQERRRVAEREERE